MSVEKAKWFVFSEGQNVFKSKLTYTENKIINSLIYIIIWCSFHRKKVEERELNCKKKIETLIKEHFNKSTHLLSITIMI